MTPWRFDRATAYDVRDAFRLLEGRIRGSGRSLAHGSTEILRAAELSLAVRSGQSSAGGGDIDDDRPMATMFSDLDCLTLDEVAHEHLHVSESTVRRLIDDGELPVVRFGRSVRIRHATLREYLQAAEANGGTK